MLLLERHAAGRHAAFFLHLKLALELTAPHRLDEAAVLRLKLLGFLERMRLKDVIVEVLLGLLEHTLLHELELLGDRRLEVLQGHDRLLAVIAAHEHALSGLNVSRAELEAKRHALHLVLRALPAHGVVRIVHLHAKSRGDQALLDLGGSIQNAFLMHRDRQNDHLRRRDLGRQHQTVVVTVCHDDSADHARRRAPRGLERILEFIVAAGKGHVVGS